MSDNSASFSANALDHIFLTEIVGNLSVNEVTTSGNVRLVTESGDILEAESDTSADDLVAPKAAGGDIGTSANPLEIDSSNSGRLFAIAGSIFLTEVAGALNVLFAHSPTTSDANRQIGTVALTVLDSPALNTENLHMVQSGHDLSPGMRRYTGQIGGEANVVLTVGDNVSAPVGTALARWAFLQFLFSRFSRTRHQATSICNIAPTSISGAKLC